MKKITLGLFALLFIGQLSAQKLKISGNLKNLPDGTSIKLIDGMANKPVDSAKSEDGKFTIGAKVENPSIYILLFTPSNSQPTQIPVFVGNDPLEILGDFKETSAIQYKGSANQDLYLAYMKALTPKVQSLFSDKSLAASPAGVSAKDSLTKQIELKETDLTNTLTNLLKANNQSPVSTLFSECKPSRESVVLVAITPAILVSFTMSIISKSCESVKSGAIFKRIGFCFGLAKFLF